MVASSVSYMLTTLRTATILLMTWSNVDISRKFTLDSTSTLENITRCLLLVIPTKKGTLQQMNSSFNDQILKWLTDYTWFIINFTLTYNYIKLSCTDTQGMKTFLQCQFYSNVKYFFMLITVFAFTNSLQYIE